LIEIEIAKLQREYADLEEIWKAEKGVAHGTRSSGRNGTSAW